MKLVNNPVVKTTMIYGNQWYEICNWLKNSGYNVDTDSTSWGNYSNNEATGHGTKQTAGYSENWKANNIYDFAGNCCEWTQETMLDTRVYRGGNYGVLGSENTASDFDALNPNNGNILFLSTRPTLYII